MQNESFESKKYPKIRRGYINGSHSEIEVAQEKDWTAQTILSRGKKLLEFMEKRWEINIIEQQKRNLLNLDFVE